MGERIFEKSVGLAQRCCEKMYLDSNTADVDFVFGTDPSCIKKVPAHKSILSTGSRVFNAMFNGLCKEKGDVWIPDTSAEAFKEFLQFFYLNEVRLTSENIAEVANLCKKYEVDDGLKACETPFQRSLTIGNMCSGFATAHLLGMSNVIRFCEREISLNAEEVLKNTDFLDCDRKLFDKILQLASTKCSAPTIVDASMAWAKTECGRKKVRETPTNLREQLNDSFHRIPFYQLATEQFALHLITYREFFTNRDLESIVLKTLSKNTNMSALTHPKSATRTLNCDRQVANSSVDFYIHLSMPYSSFFVSNRDLMLTEIFMAKSSLPNDLVCQVTIFTRYTPIVIAQEFALSSGKEAHVIFTKPVKIDTNIEYGIRLNAPMESIGFKRKPLHQTIKLRDNISIRFINDKGMMTRLVFQQPI